MYQVEIYAVKEAKVGSVERVGYDCSCTRTGTHIWWVRESHSDMATFEQKPERSEKMSHLSIWKIRNKHHG